MPFEIEHIVPESAGGDSVEANLCLACPRCNRYKGTLLTVREEATNELIALFHPRQHVWAEHFVWEQAGLYITSLTPIGRVTVKALQMNNTFVVRSRRVWIEAGWHPPRINQV